MGLEGRRWRTGLSWSAWAPSPRVPSPLVVRHRPFPVRPPRVAAAPPVPTGTFVLFVATLASALVGCRNAPSSKGLASNEQAVVASDALVDAAQVLLGVDELIAQAPGDWTTRSEGGVELRAPRGFGAHAEEIVALRGDAQRSNPSIGAYGGGKAVAAKGSCFVDVRARGWWSANASMAPANPATPKAGCDGAHPNAASVALTAPTSGPACWSDLDLDEHAGGWPRARDRPDAAASCEARVNFRRWDAQGRHLRPRHGPCRWRPRRRLDGEHQRRRKSRIAAAPPRASGRLATPPPPRWSWGEMQCRGRRIELSS